MEILAEIIYVEADVGARTNGVIEVVPGCPVVPGSRCSEPNGSRRSTAGALLSDARSSSRRNLRFAKL